MDEFDVVIIGSGPGGYVCALRCAQLGLKTALIEKYATLGGTCLNVGCIPSKALLDSSERYFNTVHSHKDHGIMVNDVKLDFTKMVSRVKNVVKNTCEGINFLMKKNKVSVFNGIGSFVDANTIEVKTGDEKKLLKAKKVVIATGSKPSSLPGVISDKQRIITSTEAIYLKEVPKRLVVIGAGVIGLELGSVYSRLGSDVTVVEYADQIISMMDADCSKELHKILKLEGMKFLTGHAVKSVERKGDVVELSIQKNETKEIINLQADYCLVAVGRKPFTDGLNLQAAQVMVDERGKIKTNESLQTNISHIYAIGDVVKGAMLAHKAEEEGVYVAEILAGQKPHLNYHLIPSVVYTWPEVASVGATEDELKKQGVEFKKGVFPVKASGRARASNEVFGFIKVLAHKSSDEILGVHMVAPRAADLIAEAVIAMEFRASAEDVARSCHAHPTYSEMFKEACLAATENRALHI